MLEKVADTRDIIGFVAGSGPHEKTERDAIHSRAALRDDFYESQHALTDAVLTDTDASGAPEARVDAWLADHDVTVGRYRDLVHDVEQADAADLAALAVVRRALRDLAEI